jgi:hypothetical protein
VPGGHASQEVRPTPVEYVPDMHGVQLAVPAAHMMHVVEVEYVPGEHTPAFDLV